MAIMFSRRDKYRRTIAEILGLKHCSKGAESLENIQLELKRSRREINFSSCESVNGRHCVGLERGMLIGGGRRGRQCAVFVGVADISASKMSSWRIDMVGICGSSPFLSLKKSEKRSLSGKRKNIGEELIETSPFDDVMRSLFGTDKVECLASPSGMSPQ